MKENSAHIDQLIARRLSGEATTEEVRELEAWMALSEANKKYFGHFEFVHQNAAASYKRHTFDVDGGWNRLHAKMQAVPAKKVKNRGLFAQSSQVLKIAASVAIVASLGILAYLYEPWNTGPTLVAISAPADSIKHETLADQSKIVLNKGASIRYSSNYGSKNRNVSLSGEAWFHVEKNDELPFIVEAEGVLVRDISKSFNIKAIPESLTVEVFVESGEVVFYTPYNPGIRLKEGEMGIFNKADSTFVKVNNNTENILSYKSLVFIFNNVPLSVVTEQLSKVYDTRVRLANNELGNCHITVTFEKEQIENIVHIIAETLGLEVKVDDEGFVLLGTCCNNE